MKFDLFFRIILDLLKLNVPPLAIIQTLRSMCSQHHPHATFSGGGEPHSNITLSRGDSCQNTSKFLQGSRSASGERIVRGTSSDRQNKNLSSDYPPQTDRRDGSGYSLISSYSQNRDRHISDNIYSNVGSKNPDRHIQSTKPAESFITTRPRNTSADYKTFKEKEKAVKKK